MSKLACSLGLVAVMVASAGADTSDEKPWDWPRYDSYIAAKSGGTICKAVAEDMKHDKLVCVLDHKSWDDHLAHELKVTKIAQRTKSTPDHCDGAVFQSLRSIAENGGFPAGDTAEAAKAEFRAKVDRVVCRFDEVDKNYFLTYDAKTKTLTFHVTRVPTSSSDWVEGEMRKMAKTFPAYDKWFAARE